MSDSLTQAQHSVLCALSDWKAPWEIILALYPNGTSRQGYRATSVALEKLVAGGLVKFGRENGTYKVTPAGRALLKEIA